MFPQIFGVLKDGGTGGAMTHQFSSERVEPPEVLYQLGLGSERGSTGFADLKKIGFG
jgi:hypothetical protein